MRRASNYVRESFIEVFASLSVISARTWLLAFLAPMYVFFSTWMTDVLVPVRYAFAAPLAALIVVSIVADIRHRPLGPWVTRAVAAWVIVFIAATIIILPKYNLHDELLLTEAGLQKIVAGVDPYATTYHGTIVERWIGHITHASYVDGVYPAWDHYVYLPGYFVASLPVYLIIHGLAGWYDQRLIYLIAYAGLLAVTWKALRRSPVREQIVMILALNPFMANATYGFNDLLPTFLLVAACFALIQKRWYLAAGLYGFALATKQTTVLTVPFIVPLLIQHVRVHHGSVRRTLGILAGTFCLVIVPFFAWSPQHMIDDTVRFFISTSAYPISGEGLSRALLLAHLVRPDQYFPFWIIQLCCAAPVIGLLWWWSRRRGTVQAAVLGSAFSIGTFWFFSRYFLPSHVYVIILLIIASFALGEAERAQNHP